MSLCLLAHTYCNSHAKLVNDIQTS